MRRSTRIAELSERLNCRVGGVWDVERALKRCGALNLAQKICDEHMVSFDATFKLRLRTPSEVRARHHFVALLRWSTGLSYPEIGGLIDMDHTSILDGVRKHEERLNGSP